MDYKLKNRDGVETTYTKDKIKIPAATGDNMVVFTQGKAQAEKTVDIAENGAFTVAPDAGFAFVKKVSGTVAVPTPVTSVNGQTGDVKTGMVVNFTLDTAQSQDITSDVPFADVLAFINESTEAKPYIEFTFNEEGTSYVFNQYFVQTGDSGTKLFIYDGYNPSQDIFSLKVTLLWSNDKVQSCVSSTAAVGWFSLSDGTLDANYPDGFFVEEFGGVDATFIEMVQNGLPVSLALDGTVATASIIGGGSNSIDFATPYYNNSRWVASGKVDKTTEKISWSVREEQIIPKVHIVHTSIVIGGPSTSDATFEEIKEWTNNSEVVLLQAGSTISQLNSSISNNSTFGFTFMQMTPFGPQMVNTMVNSDNTWSVDFVDCTTGFQYKSPSGKKFTIKVADDGTLSTKEVTT